MKPIVGKLKLKVLHISMLLCLLLVTGRASTVHAHPADLYAHTIQVTLNGQGLSIQWQIKPGPLLASYVFQQADANKDNVVNQDEADAWSKTYAPLLTASVDGQALPLQLNQIHFPTLTDLQAGLDVIQMNLSARWPGTKNSLTLELNNGFDPNNSLNWFTLSAQTGTAFGLPSQRSGILETQVVRDRSQADATSQLLTAWDSGTPALPVGQKKDIVSQTAEQVVPALAANTPQDILTRLVRDEQFSIQFYLLALAISFALGSLHALTPGHGKTVVAAYLVGSRGTVKHAFALGSIVTLTHTGSVFLLGIVTLVASRYLLPTSVVPVLEILSGVLILGLGLYLLIQRFRSLQEERQHQRAHEEGLEHEHLHRHDDHDHHHDHGHDDHDHHDHGHSHEIPETITWRSLIALGVSGGLVPCPDAIAILLVAVALNRIGLGLALIAAFSLGLAVVLISIGLVMVQGRRLLGRLEAFNRFAPMMPIVSAVVVLVLGAALTWGAYAKWQASASTASPGQTYALEAQGFDLDRAQILYIGKDSQGTDQLVVADAKGNVQRVLTNAPRGVTDFALSPDGSQIMYVYQNADFTNELWLMNADGSQNRQAVPCPQLVCRQPVFSPDGQAVVYERTNLSGEGSNTGWSSLWWYGVSDGQAKAVFQDASSPGASARFSPDGKWLSYSSPDGLKLYNLQNGENRTVKNASGSEADWSPDGASLLLRQVVSAGGQPITHLFLYRLADDSMTALNQNPNLEDVAAAWSPDGSQIALVRRDLAVTQGDQLWVMNADGSGARQLTQSANTLHDTPVWSPDGKSLLYDAYQLDSTSTDSVLQIIIVQTGEVLDLGLPGFNPTWLPGH